jgi:hypothetical protein
MESVSAVDTVRDGAGVRAKAELTNGYPAESGLGHGSGHVRPSLIYPITIDCGTLNDLRIPDGGYDLTQVGEVGCTQRE